MISIFNGRKLSLDGNEDVTYAQISVALRDKIHCFNTGKTCNPFAVFMAIALHADKDGWAWPGRSLLSKETGIKSAIGNSIKHLCKMTIAGHRVLTCWRERRDDGTWGRTLYRIFPDAWGEYVIFPERFKADNLKPWSPNGEPSPHNLPLDDLPLDNVPLKYSHVQEEPEEKTADALFYGDAGKPDRKPIMTNLPTSAKGPLDLIIKTQDAREKEGQWTTPLDGSWDVALDAWCAFIGKDKSGMTVPTQIKLKGIFRDVGAVMESTAPEVASAIGRYKERYGWWDDDWPSDGFTDRLGMLLIPDAKESPTVNAGYRTDAPGAI